MNIDPDYSYINEKEGLEMPFNSGWEISFEYQKAIIVFMQNDNQTANFGIMANPNGYPIKSAHELNSKIVHQLLNKVAPNVSEVTLTNVHVKNLSAKEVKYNYVIRNIDESYKMSGLMYMIIKKGKTYVFMMNSTRDKKECYSKFLKNVLQNTNFNTTWYENFRL
jgi:hypothetical protein